MQTDSRGSSSAVNGDSTSPSDSAPTARPTVHPSACVVWVHDMQSCGDKHALKNLQSRIEMRVRNFFDVETAARFVKANTAASNILVFCVVLTTPQMLSALPALKEHALALKEADGGCPISFYYYGPRIDDEHRRQFDRAFCITDDSSEELQHLISEEYRRRTDGMRLQSNSAPIEYVMPPPEGVPPQAKYVGDGPMGTVFLYDDDQGHPQTIRCLAADKQLVWNRTIRMQAKTLSHPKILNILRCEPECDAGRVMLAFAPAFTTNYDRLFGDEPIPECIVVRALHVVLDVLDYFHGVGFVMPSITPYMLALHHRDLKVVAAYAFPIEEAHKMTVRNVPALLGP